MGTSQSKSTQRSYAITHDLSRVSQARKQTAAAHSPSAPTAEASGGSELRVLVGARTRALKGEDTFAVLDVSIGGDQVHLCLVADGHGGSAASKLCESVVLSRIAEAAVDGSADALSVAVSTVFNEVHTQMCAAGSEAGSAGSTLTVCALNATRGELSSWNAGDSLAIL